MFINHFNEIYVMINVAINATIYGTNSVSRFGSFAMSVILSNKPPKLTGIYSKNEKRRAVSCFIPSNIAATIVAPDRLIPGISAQACATDNNCVFHRKVAIILRPRKFLIIQRPTAVIRRKSQPFSHLLSIDRCNL